MEEMTDEQINTAIAEACWWRKEDVLYMWTANGIDCTCPELWDWANDLNAMHLAEKMFDCPELYECNLIKVCGGAQYMWHATARQRAEAFLRTLGKWEECDAV